MRPLPRTGREKLPKIGSFHPDKFSFSKGKSSTKTNGTLIANVHNDTIIFFFFSFSFSFLLINNTRRSYRNNTYRITRFPYFIRPLTIIFYEYIQTLYVMEMIDYWRIETSTHSSYWIHAISKYPLFVVRWRNGGTPIVLLAMTNGTKFFRRWRLTIILSSSRVVTQVRGQEARRGT